MTVSDATIELQPGPITQGLGARGTLRQRGGEVTIVKARLLPPWMNTGLVIREGERCGLALFPRLLLGKILRSLRAAGFSVAETRTWFSLGERLLSES